MSNRLDELTQKLEKNPGANENDIKEVQSFVGKPLPRDYVEFLRWSNGAEGFVQNRYLRIFPTSEVRIANETAEVDEFAPGLAIFASDGADTAYAFDTRKDPVCIVDVPFIGMSLDEIRFCGDSLTQFLEHLASQP